MALASGTRLGAYEIVALIGSGGMGEVYRARDGRLNRDVAIKVLPSDVAADRDRLVRFEREAQVLASLNHSNIANIYGVDDSSGTPALVMELVEGPTLADRITKGPIPLDEALPIAKQIAEALEAAHEQGIIHRDLKPANIKLRPDGTVKVLDFGLAKAFDPVASGVGHATMSPTLSMHATHAGIILGTAAYMAPEQARGRPVDRRADIWAFGCVLYEMLTARRPFDGDDVSVTLAAVLKTDPDWRALALSIPPGVRRLLSRCLTKDPKERLQAIGDARVEIGEMLTGVTELVTTTPVRPVVPPWRRLIAPATALPAVLALVIGSVTGAWFLRPSPAARHPVRFTITPSGAIPLPTGSMGAASPYRDIVMSPDGKRIIYSVGRTGNGTDEPQLWVRGLDQIDGVQLPGIVGNLSGFPFMSPDGQWIGYVWGGELRKVSISGGPPISLCRVPGVRSGFRGGSWGPDDRILFATSDPATGLLSVPAGGGDVTVVTKPDPAHGEAGHVFPWVLPGGRAVLFTIVPTTRSIETAVIAALDLKSGQRKVLVRGGTAPQYIDSGHLLYASAGSLRAVRFDPRKLEVLSDPVPVVDSVLTKADGAAEFSVSRDGTLVYVRGDSQASPQRSLVWVNRQGHEEPLTAPVRAYQLLRLSPDGTRVALDIRDQQNDIWIWDLGHENLRRLTSDPGLDSSPVWTPDGRQIIFASVRAGAGDLYRQAADGTGPVEPLPKSPPGLFLTSIAPDGTRGVGYSAGASANIVILVLGERPRIDPLLATKDTTRNPEIAPNGRWLAYESNESGRFQINVRPFPNVEGGWWQVSTQGGTKPLWAPSGRELFYIDEDGYLTVVPVQTVGAFAFDKPSRVLQTRYFSTPLGRTYDVSSDGQRFLMIKDAAAVGSAPPPSMVVVLNWSDELKTRVPAR